MLSIGYITTKHSLIIVIIIIYRMPVMYSSID